LEGTKCLKTDNQFKLLEEFVPGYAQ